MLTEALALVDDIEAAIVGVECQPDRVYVSAGEPAAPNPGCTEISVWVSEVVDDNEAIPDECRVKPLLTLSYRIDWCYKESTQGPTEAEHLTAATCLYELMEAIWCGLQADLGSGDLAGGNDCKTARLGPLTLDQRQGGNVSATGSVIIEYECVTASS